MKKMLTQLLMTSVIFLLKIVTRLDKRCSFFLAFRVNPEDEQINLIVQPENFSDDIMERFQNIAAFIAEINNSHNEPVNEVLVAWEAYDGNYEIKPPPIPEFDDNDDDDEDNSTASELGMSSHEPFIIPFQMRQENVQFTPWGKFDSQNPFCPLNLYEIQIAHLRGFSIHDIADYKKMLNGIQGVAMWSVIDKHRIAIAPAKSYTASEVKEKVQNTIYKYFNVSFGKKDINEYIESLLETSRIEYQENNTDNMLIIFPEPNFSIETINDPSDKDIDDVNKMIESIKGIRVIRNGEYYKPNQSDE